jgi:hypothetical protein
MGLLYLHMFQHKCVILRELAVSTLLSYTSMSTHSLLIQFKMSHMSFVVESKCLTLQKFYSCPRYNTIVKISLLLQFICSAVWLPYLQSVCVMLHLCWPGTYMFIIENIKICKVQVLK